MEHIKIPEEVQAMRTEREALEHRMFRLGAQMAAPEVNEEDRDDMGEQYEAMRTYLSVLTRRLSRALEKV